MKCVKTIMKIIGVIAAIAAIAGGIYLAISKAKEKKAKADEPECYVSCSCCDAQA